MSGTSRRSGELVVEGIEEPGPQGDAVRESVAEQIVLQKSQQFKRMGGQLGYCYSTSPIIVRDGTEEPSPDFADYVPSASPGNRAPHVWMKDGSSLFDHFGKGFTLISLDDEINSDTLAAAAKERGIPFKVLTTSGSDREALLELYRGAGRSCPLGSPRSLAGSPVAE